MATTGVVEQVRKNLFGSTDIPQSVFGGAGAQGLFDFFEQGFKTRTLDDPRLVRFLDRANREIDRTLKSAQQNFERGLGPNQRASGDAAAFERDLAIAGSEGKSAAMTDIFEIFENLRLENAKGALAFLTAESGEGLDRSRLDLEDRIRTGQLSEGFFSTVGNFFGGFGG